MNYTLRNAVVKEILPKMLMQVDNSNKFKVMTTMMLQDLEVTSKHSLGEALLLEEVEHHLQDRLLLLHRYKKEQQLMDRKLISQSKKLKGKCLSLITLLK
jgi:pantothenate kinase